MKNRVNVLVMTIAMSALVTDTAAKSATARIDIEVRGFRNSEGQALIALFSSKKGFPHEGQKAARQKIMKIPGKSLRCSFTNVTPGMHAVTILHDENANFKMDTGFLGIPKESYGVSNNARRRFGPPSWEEARFELKAGQVVQLTIDLIH